MPMASPAARPTCLCVIPARGGSKQIPGKNLVDLGGRPLLVWSIEAALAARSVDRVVVSTEDRAIATTALKAGAEVIARPEHLASDTAPSEPVVLHALEYLGQNQGYRPDLVLFMQCTSPFTLPEDLDQARDTLMAQGGDTIFAATPRVQFLWRRDPAGGAIALNHDPGFRKRRQDLEPEYVETGAFYLMRTQGFLRQGSRFFGRNLVHPIPAERAMDIDEPWDLVVARALAREFAHQIGERSTA